MVLEYSVAWDDIHPGQQQTAEVRRTLAKKRRRVRDVLDARVAPILSLECALGAAGACW